MFGGSLLGQKRFQLRSHDAVEDRLFGRSDFVQRSGSRHATAIAAVRLCQLCDICNLSPELRKKSRKSRTMFRLFRDFLRFLTVKRRSVYALEVSGRVVG